MVACRSLHNFHNYKICSACSKLDHEYVTEFVGACFDEDLYCIVTELMSKGSVFDLLHQKRTRLPWPRRVSMVGMGSNLSMVCVYFVVYRQGMLLKGWNTFMD